MHFMHGWTLRFLMGALIAGSSVLPSSFTWAGEDEEEDCMCEEAEADCGHLNRLLFDNCFGECTGIEAHGWLAQGFTWNPSNPADRFNGPVTRNDRANEYQMNQFYLSFGREASEEGYRLGYRAEMLYGTDAFLFQSLGLDDNIVSDSASRFYQLAIPQLYLEAYVPFGPGMNVKFGHWNALVGYETGLPNEDFFYSQTFEYNTTAATNTGVLVEMPLGEHLTMLHGVHRGNCVWEDNNNALSYTGAVNWTSCDESTTLYTAISVGPEQDERADWQDLNGAPGPDAPGESLEQVIWSLNVEQQLTDSWRAIANFIYFFQEGSVAGGFENAEAYGTSAYLLYDINDCVSAGIRAEVFRDDDAFISEGLRSGNAGAAGLYTNLTLGMNVALTDCIKVRPEVRWDWQDRDNPADTPAFDNGTSTNQFLFAFDVIATF
jgi:hypothetical protein